MQAVLDLENVWDQFDVTDCDVQKNLGIDATYRVQQVLELARNFMRHAKRKALLIEDLDNAMKWMNVNPVYGHSGESPIFEAVPEADVLVQADPVVNLLEIVSAPSIDVISLPQPYLDFSKLRNEKTKTINATEDYRTIAKCLFDENQEFVELVINSCRYFKDLQQWRTYFREVLSAMTLKASTVRDEVLGRRVMHLTYIFYEDYKVLECDYSFLNSILTPLLDMDSVRVQAAAFIARLGEETFIRKRLTHAVNVPEKEHISKVIPLLLVLDPVFAAILLLYHYNEKENRLKFFTQLAECPLTSAVMYRLQRIDLNADLFVRMQAFLFALQRDSQEGTHARLRFADHPLPVRGDPHLPIRLPVTPRTDERRVPRRTSAPQEAWEGQVQYLRSYRHFYMVGEHVRAVPVDNLRRKRRKEYHYQQSAYQFLVKRYCRRKNGVIRTIGASKACGFDLTRFI